MGNRAGWLFALGGLLASGFGIYVGRFLRWNSWDILTNPFSLARELGHHILLPWEHPRTWGVTLVLGGLLGLMYIGLHLFAPKEKQVYKIRKEKI
jgi:uncharacterized membrane protein